jgi:hypothetical protein
MVPKTGPRKGKGPEMANNQSVDQPNDVKNGDKGDSMMTTVDMPVHKRQHDEISVKESKAEKRASHHEQRHQRRKVLHENERDADRGGSGTIAGRSGVDSELNILDTKVQHLLRKDTYDFSLSYAAFKKHNVQWRTKEERAKSNPHFGKPPSAKEAMRLNRREKWIREFLKIDPDGFEGIIKEVVIKCRNLPNIPWKRPAFNNFMKKQMKITDVEVVDELWNICDDVTERTRHVNSAEAMAVELEKRREEWAVLFHGVDVASEPEKVILA